jgi:hypothetical protein
MDHNTLSQNHLISILSKYLIEQVNFMPNSNSLSLTKARSLGKLDQFIRERDAEGQAPGDANKLTAYAKLLSETPKSVRRTSKKA